MTTKYIEGDQIEQIFHKQHICYQKKYNDPKVADQICEAIFMLIPGVARLKELFLGWSLLPPKDRETIDEQLQQPDMYYLYRPLKEALIRYEIIQDTQGAPGCEPGLVSFSSDPQLEEGLTEVIHKLEDLLETVQKQDSDEFKYSKVIKSTSNIREFMSEVGTMPTNGPLTSSKGRPIYRSASMDDITNYRTA
ncbi:uncharacterized protein LOC142329109 [Lycorma delicatula]|uniref:uncharacterized protein LOC142329109 n=1 Tax=Lycorma delicatula TaxID=130591 RepID=UPI003F5198C1